MGKTDRGLMMGRHFCMNIGLKLFNNTNLSTLNNTSVSN